MVNKHKPGSEQQKLVFPSEAQVLHKSNTQLSHARTSYHADLLSLQTGCMETVWGVADGEQHLGNLQCVFQCNWKAGSLRRSWR